MSKDLDIKVDGNWHKTQMTDPVLSTLEVTEGKTLRDEFAMAALTGLLVNDEPDYTYRMAASDAYEYADAMLEARNNG